MQYGIVQLHVNVSIKTERQLIKRKYGLKKWQKFLSQESPDQEVDHVKCKRLQASAGQRLPAFSKGAGSHEVRGSIPLSSTKNRNENRRLN